MSKSSATSSSSSSEHQMSNYRASEHSTAIATSSAWSAASGSARGLFLARGFSTHNSKGDEGFREQLQEFLVQKEGFDVIANMEKMSLMEVADTVSRHQFVVAVEGAQLHHLFWLQPCEKSVTEWFFSKSVQRKEFRIRPQGHHPWSFLSASSSVPSVLEHGSRAGLDSEGTTRHIRGTTDDTMGMGGDDTSLGSYDRARLATFLERLRAARSGVEHERHLTGESTATKPADSCKEDVRVLQLMPKQRPAIALWHTAGVIGAKFTNVVFEEETEDIPPGVAEWIAALPPPSRNNEARVE